MRYNAVAALKKFDSPEGVTAINEALLSGDSLERVYLLQAFSRASPGNDEAIRHEFSRLAIPGILSVMSEEDARLRELAIMRASEIGRSYVRAAGQPTEVVWIDEVKARLESALDDENIDVVWAAVQRLAGSDPQGQQELAPALLRVVRNPRDQYITRKAAAASLLARVDPATEGLLPILRDLVRQEDNDHFDAHTRALAVDALWLLGPRAAPMASDLIDIVQDDSSERVRYPPYQAWYYRTLKREDQPATRPYSISLRLLAIHTLGRIGPAAKDALPVLRKFADESPQPAAGGQDRSALQDAELRREAASQAIRSITGSDTPATP